MEILGFPYFDKGRDRWVIDSIIEGTNHKIEGVSYNFNSFESANYFYNMNIGITYQNKYYHNSHSLI